MRCETGCRISVVEEGWERSGAAQSEPMRILMNGESREIPEGQTVLRLLESLGLDPGRVAVELDGEILRKSEWAGRVLAPGARLEIVHFVGGG